VPVRQTSATELGVPVVRKSQSDEFYEDVRGAGQSLRVRFDPATWLASVDLRSYVEFETCAPEQAGVVCDGLVEWTCTPSDAAVSRDCAATGDVCVAGVGCADRVVIEPSSEAFRALRNALTAGARPEFTWVQAE
jgi:hypothetical protein